MKLLRVTKILGWDISGLDILKGGAHSEIFVVQVGNEQRVIKILGGKRKPMSLDEAEMLKGHLGTYHGLLSRAGFRMPELLELKLFENLQRSSYEIIYATSYVGQDIESTELKGGSEVECVRLSEEILTELDKLFEQREGDDLEIGIDPKPQNFTRKIPGGPLHFTDTMPPRYRINGRVAVMDYPLPPKGLPWDTVYYKVLTVKGILTVLANQLGRIRPDLFHGFWDLVSKKAQQMGFEEDFGENSRLWKFWKGDRQIREEIIRSLGQRGDDIDLLRGIIVVLGHEGRMVQNEVDSLFWLCHIDDYVGEDIFPTFLQLFLNRL